MRTFLLGFIGIGYGVVIGLAAVTGQVNLAFAFLNALIWFLLYVATEARARHQREVSIDVCKTIAKTSLEFDKRLLQSMSEFGRRIVAEHQKHSRAYERKISDLEGVIKAYEKQPQASQKRSG